MIVQNPIIGRAKNKLSGIYARTLNGKNVLQSCPPPTKGKQTESQVASSTMFGELSRLSNQVSASLLNMLFYSAPIGRTRRAEWCRQLGKAMRKENNLWIFDPSLITSLGGNAKVCSEPYIFTPTQNQLRIAKTDLPSETIAIQSEIPCLILICADTKQCISLLPWTTIDEDEVILTNLSTTYLNHECFIFPLWQFNIGTQNNPILTYGAYAQ